MEPLSALLGAGGFVLGLAADRLATRWPDHDEEHPPGRAVDWRTATTALVGALAFGLLPVRFDPVAQPVAFVVFGAWFATLVVGLGTDLDQRLLPDILTLPAIPVGLVWAASGSNPLVGAELVPALIAAVAIPAVLFVPSIPFGAGAFGIGDVKLLAGVGLLVGGDRALSSVVFALLLSGIVLVMLLAARRIGRRTYVPFGPFFILGALWAVLIRV
jgi:leader peptidase (prepilin peptidase)/N-methyltransferase